MRCEANQNGSQVECDLGNPVKRDAKVRTKQDWLQITYMIKCAVWKIISSDVVNNCLCLSSNSPSTWAHPTSPLRPLSWKQISFWPRKPLPLTLGRLRGFRTLFHQHWLLPFQYLAQIKLSCAEPDCLVFSISEQSDLAPVTAFAKVVIELPLSVSGWVAPETACQLFSISLLCIEQGLNARLGGFMSELLRCQLSDSVTCIHVGLPDLTSCSSVAPWEERVPWRVWTTSAAQ